MSPEELASTETWGERMAREARAIMARWPVATAVTEALAPLLERIATRAMPEGRRFQRQEAVAIRPAAPPAEPPVADESLAGAPLPGLVRERLDGIVGPAARSLRVHTDESADGLARRHRAAAVTVGRDLFFRRGEYRPEDPHGFALLAHEATHAAAALDPALAARRATPLGIAAEEGRARARELELRHPGAGPIPMRIPTAPPAPAARVNVPPAARPMAAAEDRPLDPAPPSPPPRIDMDGLRRGLFRDLLAQLRTDFERGG